MASLLSLKASLPIAYVTRYCIEAPGSPTVDLCVGKFDAARRATENFPCDDAARRSIAKNMLLDKISQVLLELSVYALLEKQGNLALCVREI